MSDKWLSATHVVATNSRGKSCYVPKLQAAVNLKHKDSWLRFDASPAPSSNILSTGAQVELVVPQKRIQWWSRGYLEYTVAVASNTVTVTGSHNWIEYVDVIFNRNEQQAMRIYPDEIFINSFTLPENRRKRTWENGMKMDGETAYISNAYSVLDVATHYVRIPFLNSWLDNANANLLNLREDIILRIKHSSDVIITGSGTLTVSNIALVVKNQEVNEYERMEQKKMLSSVGICAKYLDWFRVLRGSDINWAASTNYRVDLDSVRGVVPFLAVMFRPANTPNTVGATNEVQIFESLGDSATFDLVDPSGTSVFGNSAPLTGRQLKEIFMAQFPNMPKFFNAHKQVYFLPFCESIQNSLMGQRNGGIEFNGQKYQLSITQPAAGTAEVHTITMSGTSAASGSFIRFGFAGCVTDMLAYNCSASTAQTAINGLASMRRAGYSCTVSASPVSTFTVTFSLADGSPSESNNGELVQMYGTDIATSVPAPISCISSLTTKGYKGALYGTGTSYSVAVWAPRFAEGTIYPDGTWEKVLLQVAQ